MKLFRIRKLHQDEKGLTLLEYAAGAGFLIVIASSAFFVMGGKMGEFFNTLGDQIVDLAGTPAVNP